MGLVTSAFFGVPPRVPLIGLMVIQLPQSWVLVSNSQVGMATAPSGSVMAFCGQLKEGTETLARLGQPTSLVRAVPLVCGRRLGYYRRHRRWRWRVQKLFKSIALQGLVSDEVLGYLL